MEFILIRQKGLISKPLIVTPSHHFHHAGNVCWWLTVGFPRRVSSVPLVPVSPSFTHPPTDESFCSFYTTLLRSWPFAFHPPSHAYAQGTVTSVCCSAPAIAGVRTLRRHRRRRQSTRKRRRGHTTPSPAPSGVPTSSHCTRIRKECGRLPTHNWYMPRVRRVDVASLKNQSSVTQITHIRHPRRNSRRSLLSAICLLDRIVTVQNMLHAKCLGRYRYCPFR